MTQLERELKRELELQRELFSRELSSITKRYEDNLLRIGSGYQKMIDEQKSIIEKQNQIFIKYGEISKNLQISIDNQSLQSLKQMHQSSMSKFRLFQESLAELENGLEKLENQLKELKMN
jgi:uracil DNA glycosylase